MSASRSLKHLNNKYKEEEEETESNEYLQVNKKASMNSKQSKSKFS